MRALQKHGRTTALAVGFYCVSFSIGLMNATVHGVDLATATDLPDKVWLTGVVAHVLLVVLFTRWYFRPAWITPSLRAGRRFALFLLVVSLLCDFILSVVFTVQSGSTEMVSNYFSEVWYWIVQAVTFVTPQVVAVRLAKRK